MIVVKGNVERIIKDDQLNVFEKNGYKPVGKTKVQKSHKNDIDSMEPEELKKLAEEKALEGFESLNIKELRAALKAYGSAK